MALFDRFLARQVKTGELTLVHPDGTTKHFGKPDPAYNPVTIRLTKPGVAGAIIRHPARGAAEAFMDGRLVIVRGVIRDLVNLL